MSVPNPKKHIAWTASATLIKVAVQLIVLALAARFLPAEQLGSYALVHLVLAFATLFSEMGLMQSVVHHQTDDKRKLGELGLLNLLICAGLTALVWLIADHIAAFFADPRLSELLQWVSFSFVIMGLSRVNLAVLQRDLAFTRVAIVDMTAAILSLPITLWLLSSLGNVTALILGLLAQQVMLSLGYWLATSGTVFFAIPTSLQRLRHHLRFGAFQTASAIVNAVNAQIDILLVGKLLGTEVLGGYSLVRQLCFRPAMVINPVLTKVAFPYMAKMQQDRRLGRVYQKMSASLAALNFPIYLSLCVFAHDVILFMFGETWLHLTTLMQILAIWCLVRSIINPVGSLLLAKGWVARSLYWNIGLMVVFPITILLASQTGVVGIASALLVLQLIVLLLHWRLLIKPLLALSAAEFFSVFVRPLGLAALSSAVIWPLSAWLETLHLWWGVFVSVGFTALIYGALSWRWNRAVFQNPKTAFAHEQDDIRK